MVDKKGLKEIEAAVREAELKTAGEIRVCIARRSSRIPLSILFLGAILGCLAGYFAAWWWAWGHPTQNDASLLVSGGVLITLTLLLFLWPRRKEAVHERALIEFHRMGISGTTGRTGVLLYLSLAERQAEIVADRAIDEKVTTGTWQQIIDRMIAGIRERRMTAAVAGAVREIALPLATHFPRKPDDVNELPDNVETR